MSRRRADRNVTPAVALTVAGSDPGGGAGIQADLRTWAALGVHGTTVVAALTVQDTREVYEVRAVDAELVRRQMEVVTADLPPAATKTGLLGSAEVVGMVAEFTSAGGIGPLVVDPVLRASTGAELASASLVDAYRDLLLPRATVVTPNLYEATRLLGGDRGGVGSIAEVEDVARALLDIGVEVAVVTGGHLPVEDATVVDVVASADGVMHLAHGRVATRNDHGTGCTFSAALTAYLALGFDVVEAAEAAGQFVARALAGAVDWRLGAGPGPIDQAGWISG